MMNFLDIEPLYNWRIYHQRCILRQISMLKVFKSRFKGQKTDNIFYNTVERDELSSAAHK